jgi:hypothetical protein
MLLLDKRALEEIFPPVYGCYEGEVTFSALSIMPGLQSFPMASN